jgi:dTDP-4-dehydrorhamnose reductase
LAFKIVLTEQHSALAQKLLSELEKLTFSVSVLEADGALQQDCAQWLDKIAPALVINTAAFTPIELPLDGFFQALRARALPLIHVSSHCVFAPRADAKAHLESDPPNNTGAEAEAFIRAEQQAFSVKKHLVLRLSLLIDSHPEHWFMTLAAQLMASARVPVSETHRLDPITLSEACRVLIAITQQILSGAENWGVMHLHPADACYEAEMAEHLVRLLKKENWPSAHVEMIKEPSPWVLQGGVLGGQRLTNNFGVQMRSWRLGLKNHLQKWLAQQKQGQLF